MGEKTAKEMVELYKMLGANSQQKSARGRRGVVNEDQTNNRMATQLTTLTRQVTLLTSRAQPINKACGICGIFSHEANVCPQSLYEPEPVNYLNANQPKQHFDPYANTYNPGQMSHPNFSW